MDLTFKFLPLLLFYNYSIFILKEYKFCAFKNIVKLDFSSKNKDKHLYKTHKSTG